jgi:hypothetical protein
MMSLLDGRKTIDVAGVAQLLFDPYEDDQWFKSARAIWVSIRAIETNVGRVAIGGRRVENPASTTRTGWPLSADDAVTLWDICICELWLNAETVGEGVTYLAEIVNGQDVNIPPIARRFSNACLAR